MKPEMFLKSGKEETRTISVLWNFVLEKNNLWNQRCFWNLPPCFLWFSKKLCWYSTFRIWMLIQKYELYYKCKYKKKWKKIPVSFMYLFFYMMFFPLHYPLHSSRENVFENRKSQIGTWARIPKCVRPHIAVFISASCLHKNYDERESF